MSEYSPDNIKFIDMIFCYYDKKKIIDLIYSYDIYKTKENLVTLDNFICELHDDLFVFCSNYDFEKIINIFLTKNNYELQMSYSRIFDEIFMMSTFCNEIHKYKNIIEIEDFELFQKIIIKYSNIKLSDKQIIFDPSTNIVVSNKNFNLSNVLLTKIIDSRNIAELISKIYPDKLELLLNNVKKNNSFLEKILFSNKYPESLNKYYSDLLIKTKHDLDENTKSKELLIILVKMFIENNIFDNFTEILNIAYSRSYVSFIETVLLFKPDLLDINLNMLKKIMYYGRFEVFEKIYWHIPWKIHSILKDHNPFDFGDFYYDYTYDIYGGSYWGRDEYDRTIIGKREHDKLFKLILSIAEEKNYIHVGWTEEIKTEWIKRAIEYESESDESLSYRYFISYEELKKIFRLEFDFTSKESIKKHIELFGKQHTWDMIKLKCKENFLDLLFV